MDRNPFGPRGAYATRLLAPPDLASLQTLFDRAADYFEIATGRGPARDEAPRAFVAGPPSKSVNDKRVIGAFTREGALIGVLDALMDWPAEREWTMGMLLLDPDHRGRGLGGALLDAYERWAAAAGAGGFRTALVGHHERGIRFLEARGYERLSLLENYDAGGRRADVWFFRKGPRAGENPGNSGE